MKLYNNISNKKSNFIFITFFSLLLISIINNIFFITESKLGTEYIGIYFLYSILFLYLIIYILELTHIKHKIFLVFLLYKIPLSFFMLYLIINRWDGGDLNGYYYHVIDAIENDSTIYGFSNVMVIQWFNYILFHILPNSLYGMMFFYALLSMSSYLIIYSLFLKYAKQTKLLFVCLLMLPIITLQSSFFGKDAYMLLIISFLFILYSKIIDRSIYIKYNFIYMILFIFCLFLIYSIRSYQAAIILVSLYLTFISRNKFLFLLGGFISIFIVVLLFDLIIVYFLGNIDLSNFNFSNALGSVYNGGSLMLEAYPVPFNILQVFRPFPWEINSQMMLFISIGNIILLFSIIYLLKKNFKIIIFRIKTNKLYKFLFFYVVISIFIYSFNPNMGDMTRRAIYFIPFLMILLV